MVVEALAVAVSARVGAAGGWSGSWWLQAVGWAAQGLFSARVLIQWYASERARRPVAPRVFWYCSVAGAVVGSVYCILREEFVVLPGYVMTCGIYLRNLRIDRRGPEPGRVSTPAFVAVALLVAGGSYLLWLRDDPSRTPPSPLFLVVGIAGQVLWIGRFLLQWHHAERHGKSEFPPAFWWLTIAGGALNTVYSMHGFDLPLNFGFLLSWV